MSQKWLCLQVHEEAYLHRNERVQWLSARSMPSCACLIDQLEQEKERIDHACGGEALVWHRVLRLSPMPKRAALDRPLWLLVFIFSALCLPCIGAVTISAFSLVNGTCVVNGSCATSPGFPSNYGSDERCSITVEAAGYLTATTFDTENDYDKLTVDGTDYSGSTGPFNQAVPSGAAVAWESDGSVNAQGWQLCYSTTATLT